MKRTALLSVIIMALVFLTACGTPAAAQPPTIGGSSNNQASSAAGATEVDITLADNTIQSSLATFKVGVPYKFVIINNGNHLHSFAINTPVPPAADLQAATATALLLVPQEKLPVGGGTTVIFTFPASAAGAPLEFSCMIPRHYELGMRLPITVTK